MKLGHQGPPLDHAYPRIPVSSMGLLEHTFCSEYSHTRYLNVSPLTLCIWRSLYNLLHSGSSSWQHLLSSRRSPSSCLSGLASPRSLMENRDRIWTQVGNRVFVPALTHICLFSNENSERVHYGWRGANHYHRELVRLICDDGFNEMPNIPQDHLPPDEEGDPPPRGYSSRSRRTCCGGNRGGRRRCSTPGPSS